MPITLKQAKVGMTNKIDLNVIDEFRRDSFLLDNLTFDNTISAGTGGSTLAYNYMRQKTAGKAGFRGINKEYTAGEIEKELKIAFAKVFGGAFEVDRVIAQTSGKMNEVLFQMQEKIKATKALFHYTAINGTNKTAQNETNDQDFEGLSSMLKGSSTEFGVGNATESIDLSTIDLMGTNANAFVALLDEMIYSVDGKPDALFVNGLMKSKMNFIARKLGYFSQSEDAFGRKVDNYDGIPIIDLGEYFDGSKTHNCVEIRETTVETNYMKNTTDIFAVKLGVDAFHGISVQGNNIITTIMPDFKTAGAVKRGEVEMIAGVVLKNSKKAGVLRNIKVKAGV